MKRFLQTSKQELLIILLLSLFPLFLVPNRIFGMISFLLSFFLSSFLLYQAEKEENVWRNKLSLYSFLHSFFDSLTLGRSAKQSYELATRYLVGYQERKTYEEILENPKAYPLFGYEEYFLYALGKVGEGEVHLSDYRPLMNTLAKEETRIEEKLRKAKAEKRKNLLGLGAIFLLLLLLVFLSLRLQQMMENGAFVLAEAILLGLACPCVYFGYKGGFSDEAKAEK